MIIIQKWKQHLCYTLQFIQDKMIMCVLILLSKHIISNEILLNICCTPGIGKLNLKDSIIPLQKRMLRFFKLPVNALKKLRKYSNTVLVYYVQTILFVVVTKMILHLFLLYSKSFSNNGCSTNRFETFLKGWNRIVSQQ